MAVFAGAGAITLWLCVLFVLDMLLLKALNMASGHAYRAAYSRELVQCLVSLGA